MNVLVGTQFYAAGPDAARRQEQCAASLRALRHADVVNVQWRDDVFEMPGIETLPVLERDAAAVVGIAGRRKPIVSDLLDALADAATARGLRHFAFVNADIVVTQAAVDRIRGGQRQTCAFSRMDVDATGIEAGIVVWGVDAFAFDVDWWRLHRRRFRPYVLGEVCFDNVFTAIMMAHGDGIIENRAGEIRHERHTSQSGGAYSRFNYYLAALDSPYFSMWARYIAELDTLRGGGASPEAEAALVRRIFVQRRSPLGAIWHAGRSVRARWRYVRDRARLSASATGAPR